MDVYNTIYSQKLFHEKDKQYQNSLPGIYLTKLLNNNFKPISIVYKYPFKLKHNSIFYNFELHHKLTDNKQFKLFINKGSLILDSVLVEVNEDFELEIPDISIFNYKYCNILFTVNFDFYKYINDKSNNIPRYNLYLYDSITGEIHNPNNNFDVAKTIVLETYSIYYRNGNFTIVPYRDRLRITDTYDQYNYLYLNPAPTYYERPYPNVENDNPDYTHDHVLTHNHCFSQDHDHNSNINLIQKYYSEKIKISENTNPPPQNIINNILSLNNPVLDILNMEEYPLLLELFNKCNLEIIDLNNLSFDFRYINPYQEELDIYNKNKYNYSRLIDYTKIEYNKIVIKYNNFVFYFPIRTHNYWLYLLHQHDYDLENIDFFNSLRYRYIYEDNINNFGCFCK